MTFGDLRPGLPARKRVLFRFHENAERANAQRPAAVEDKGSFRLTARPRDGPKASRLPSHGREIFFPTSLPAISDTSVRIRERIYIHPAWRSRRVSHSGLRLPLPPFARFPSSAVSQLPFPLRSPYNEQRVPRGPSSRFHDRSVETTARFSTTEI